MNVLVTGSGGLIGSEVVDYYCGMSYKVTGIDNNSRKLFFGEEGSVDWRIKDLVDKYGNLYNHLNFDITKDIDYDKISGNRYDLIIHCAAQPSHDWAVKDPILDFNINAYGTLKMLEYFKIYNPEAVFIFTSTNKVYGDGPNYLEYVDDKTRWTPKDGDIAKHGFDETLSIDQTLHSIFGATKVSGDVLVQEYGKYFGLNTGVFRGGCLTGKNHSGVKLHGFLSYLVKCCVTNTPYIINGYDGKQVRDNIHSNDLILAFDEFRKSPTQGDVYNIGGGTFSNCSILEAITILEDISGKKMSIEYNDINRIGDHKWWISDTRKFKNKYQQWNQKYDIVSIIEEIYMSQLEKIT
jgi:CDP-paratose 2-epimerase